MGHKKRYYIQNCHGIAVDDFMRFQSRARWREVREFFPYDEAEPTHPVLHVDDSWIGRRSFDSFTFEESVSYRAQFMDWRHRKIKAKNENITIQQRRCRKTNHLRDAMRAERAEANPSRPVAPDETRSPV